MRFFVAVGNDVFRAFPVQHSKRAMERAAVFSTDLFGPGLNMAILTPLKTFAQTYTMSVREMNRIAVLEASGMTVEELNALIEEGDL
jgi:hypothetical protein